MSNYLEQFYQSEDPLFRQLEDVIRKDMGREFYIFENVLSGVPDICSDKSSLAFLHAFVKTLLEYMESSASKSQLKANLLPFKKEMRLIYRGKCKSVSSDLVSALERCFRRLISEFSLSVILSPLEKMEWRQKNTLFGKIKRLVAIYSPIANIQLWVVSRFFNLPELRDPKLSKKKWKLVEAYLWASFVMCLLST